MRKIKTKHGLVNINDWGQGLCYQITVNPIMNYQKIKEDY